jgi:type IV secretory pathway VirJ component
VTIFGRIAALLVLALLASAAQAQEHVSHGRFADVALYRPEGAPKSVVLFLSGDGGWNQGVDNMARALVGQGALVAGVDVPRFLASFKGDTGCAYPDGDLENLAHYLEGYAKLPTYFAPVLVGYSSGATLAYAMLAQAPQGTFAAAVSLGFCPELAIRARLCEGSGLESAPPGGKELRLLPSSQLGGAWVALHGERDAVCDVATTREFVTQAHDATLVTLPSVGHGYSVEANWLPQFLHAFNTTVDRSRAALPPPSLPDLPIVEAPVDGANDLFAVMLSGDGGWAGLDKSVAAALVARGIPVVGWDSLRYFWNARTPDGLAADLDRVLRYYASRWHKTRAVLIGYSQGADVLPFALNRLSPTARALVVRSVLLAPSEKASFEFHLTSWIGANTGDLPVVPEIERLQRDGVVCIFGADDGADGSPCNKLGDPARVQALPGGHHFNGAYSDLARAITDGLRW